MKGFLLILLVAGLAFAACIPAQAPASATKPGSSTSGTSQSIKPTSFTPVIRTFWANPPSVDKGQGVTLTWSAYGADLVSIDHGVGSVASTGSVRVYPSATTIYKMTASSEGGIVTATDQVTVFAQTSSIPVIAWFTANPSTIPQGGATVLSWKVNNAGRVTLSGRGTVPSSGSLTVYPTGSSTYTLEASNGAGYSTDSATVTVVYMGTDVYYETYLIPVPEPGGGGYSGADEEIMPYTGPGGGGFSGASGDQPSDGAEHEIWTEQPQE